MGEVLSSLDWKYLVVVYEDSLYGREAYESLRPILAKLGICLTAAIMVDGSDTSSVAMQAVVQKVLYLKQWFYHFLSYKFSSYIDLL